MEMSQSEQASTLMVKTLMVVVKNSDVGDENTSKSRKRTASKDLV